MIFSLSKLTQKLHISPSGSDHFAKRWFYRLPRIRLSVPASKASKPDTHSLQTQSFDQTCYSWYHARTNAGLIDETTGTRRPVNRRCWACSSLWNRWFQSCSSWNEIAFHVWVWSVKPTDQDGFAWTTSIMDNCLVLGFTFWYNSSILTVY